MEKPSISKQNQRKLVQRVNINKQSQDNNISELIHVLNRIAESLEERNLREEKLFKLEEKIKKFELKEAQQKFRMNLDENREL